MNSADACSLSLSTSQMKEWLDKRFLDNTAPKQPKSTPSPTAESTADTQSTTNEDVVPRHHLASSSFVLQNPQIESKSMAVAAPLQPTQAALITALRGFTSPTESKFVCFYVVYCVFLCFICMVCDFFVIL